jgi:hypothetical protein
MKFSLPQPQLHTCLGVATPESTLPPPPDAACQNANRSASSCASCSYSRQMGRWDYCRGTVIISMLKQTA